MNTQGKQWLLLISMLSLSASAFGEPTESLSNIQHNAEEFVLAQISSPEASDQTLAVKARDLDRRLALPACSIPLESFFPSHNKLEGNLSVGVECKGDRPWRVFVSVLVERFGKVLVTNETLPRGHQLTASDFHLQEMNLTRLPAGYVQDSEQLIGLEVSRTIYPDQPLLYSYTQKPILIKRGEEVQILANIGGIEVHSKGKALQDASKGESLPIKANGSGRVIEAIAKEQGVAQVKM